MQSHEHTISLPTVRCPKCKGTKLVDVTNPTTNAVTKKPCFGCAGKGVLTPDDARRNIKYAKTGERSVSRKTVKIVAQLFTDDRAKEMEWPEEGLYIQLPVLTGHAYRYAPRVTADLVGQDILVPSLSAKAWVPAYVVAVNGLTEPATEEPKPETKPGPAVADKDVAWQDGVFGRALVAAGQEPAEPKTFEEAVAEYFARQDGPDPADEAEDRALAAAHASVSSTL